MIRKLLALIFDSPLHWDSNGVLRDHTGRPIRVASVSPERLPPRR